jgi:hypothetical protein
MGDQPRNVYPAVGRLLSEMLGCRHGLPAVPKTRSGVASMVEARLGDDAPAIWRLTCMDETLW